MPGKQMASKLSLMLLAILVLSMVCGCCMCCGVGNGKFVFLERSTNETWKLLSGSDPVPQPVPSVPYSYDDSTHKLWLIDPLNFANNYPGLKIVYGERALVGIGGRSNLYYVHDLPYGDGDVTIEKVDGDGTVYFSYKKQNVVLKPGESWSGEAYSVNLSTFGVSGPLTVSLTKADTLTNYGLLDASDIAA